MSSRRQFLAGSAVLGLGGVLEAPARAAELPAGGIPAWQDRPNIVVVLADDLGYGEVGAYGQRHMQTPVLDRLAREGMRFTQAYASAPVCAPSRCSLLTGLHSGHARVRENPRNGKRPTLSDRDTTFAELLQAQGYRTALFGKWGFGPDRADQSSHPNRRGFDEFYGYMSHGDAHDYYPDRLWRDGTKTTLAANARGRRGVFAPDLFRDRAVAFVKKQKDDPFLLFFSPNLPHAPNDGPALRRYAGKDWSKANKGHAAQVTRLDSHIGDILDAVRKRSRGRRTIVIVTSDNGPHEEGGYNPDRFNANGPLRGYKRNLYEGGIRVPLIVWSPGLVPKGRSGRQTQHIDVLPTLAELAGAALPGKIDGLSFARLITGRRGTRSHDHLYWYRREAYSTARANAAERGSVKRVAEAVRQGDWKLVRIAPGTSRPASEKAWKVELYNLRNDPGEKKNVVARHPLVTARLTKLVRKAWV